MNHTIIHIVLFIWLPVAATVIDGHNWMFHVAYGVLEVESEQSWT
jgi:hypothetical protein